MSTHDERDDGLESMIERVMDMDDTALDAMVSEMAADYNAPPSRPPAAAMWAHIEAAQRPVRRVQGHARWQRWQLLAASVAFLAFGLTIGREWGARTHESTGRASTERASTERTPSIASTSPSLDAAEPAPSATVAAAAVSPRSEARSTEPRSRAVEVPSPRTAAVRNETTDASETSDGSDAAYRLATLRHFTAAEALLASYDANGRDAKADAQMASWAGDLLAQTRLLLDSPAARDPVRRKLLQDLELVLVQMAQLSPASPRVEHDLIDGSVRHNDILTRLHSAVPAGATTEL